MASDQEARTDLRNALVSYMTGEIRTHEFSDHNLLFQSTKTTDDLTVCQISRFLYLIHDDLIDHPISVSPESWAVLRRIVAYLHTDLEIETTEKQPAWPFHSDEQWQQNERLLDESGLPEYDPEIHFCQVNSWWNRIPSNVGFAIIGSLLVLVLIFIILA